MNNSTVNYIINETNTGGNPESDILTAVEIVMEQYVNPKYPNVGLPERQEAASEWHQIVGGGNL